MDDIKPQSEDEQPPLKRAARINLFAKLREARELAKHPPKKPEPEPEPVVEQPQPEEHAGHEKPDRTPQIITAVAVGVLALGAAGVLAYTQFHKETPAVVNTPAFTPQPASTPTTKPSAKPTPLPTIVPAPPAPAAPQNTYTVQPGDTLITIGEKLHKDWQAIAAANGFIADPNLIFPGQVLKIP